MKKIFILLITIFTFSNVTFASFPVVQSDGIEVVQSDDNSFAPNSYMTGIFLGLFLGIFGVLIAYSMDDDEMVRGAWIGALISTLISIAMLYYFAYIWEAPDWNGWWY